jgi:protein-S-isoprenylcysteine O-methyltransferase Ste14
MDILRCYLLAGLIIHKAVWEVLKRRESPAQTAKPFVRSARARLAKTVKIGILLGIITQTFVPEVLQIASDPFFLRLSGSILYTAGLILAIRSRIQLGGNWSDIETAQILRHQGVVTDGIYRYIRHPIYVGDLALLHGLELCLNSWLVVAVVAITPIVLRQALHEEKMLIKSLPGYAEYCGTTKRFIPFIV